VTDSMTVAEGICLLCRRPFVVTTEEMRYLEDVALAAGWERVRPPARCYRCRRQARRVRQSIQAADRN
jgi:hypothetical protein